MLVGTSDPQNGFDRRRLPAEIQTQIGDRALVAGEESPNVMDLIGGNSNTESDTQQLFPYKSLPKTV